MILFRIALRNILATRVRTLIIGFLIVFGTMLVILGGSLMTTLDQSMSKSIIGSVAGHLQVYSAEAKDTLEFFSPPTGTPNLGVITDFPEVKKTIMGVAGVESVVPMGTDFAMVFGGNIMDVKLLELREAVEAGRMTEARVVAAHLRRIVSLLGDHMENLKGFARQEALDEDENSTALEDLEKANSDEFWDSFDADPEGLIVFLENKVAKLAMDEDMLFLRYLGTDSEAFRKNFELFEVEKGQMIPPGQRGFLFSDFMYERQVKNKVARRLDRIKLWMDEGKTIAEDKGVSSRIKMNVRQYKDIVFQLDGPTTEELAGKLRTLLGTEEQDFVELVKQFLDMSDGNFYERYDFFYEQIAPEIILFSVRIGDTLTIRAYTRSGYSTAVNVKVYGTYKFRGMEKSGLSGAYNLLDIMSFRDLYGHLSEEVKGEINELKIEAGIIEVERENVEDSLFGDEDGEIVEVESADGFDEFADIDMADGGLRFTEDLLGRVYTQEEIEGGVVMHAAIRLQEGVGIGAAKESIQAALDAADMNMTVIDWREASGLVGQFIGVVWIVLVTAIFIIFLVALVIINNSMVMATLDRTREIGTMRAIGAQRRYILKMFMIESSVLAFGFGLLGMAIGAAIVLVLGYFGIPAVSDELYFIFAGPRLYPILTVGQMTAAFVVVFLVSVASTVYPARLATRIEPVIAMGKED
jgi:ABC-type lipoprotein release transport system permease subunit